MAVPKAKELTPAQRIRRAIQGQDCPQKRDWPQPVGKMMRWDPEPGSGKFSECIFWVKSDPLCGLEFRNYSGITGQGMCKDLMILREWGKACTRERSGERSR